MSTEEAREIASAIVFSEIFCGDYPLDQLTKDWFKRRSDFLSEKSNDLSEDSFKLKGADKNFDQAIIDCSLQLIAQRLLSYFDLQRNIRFNLENEIRGSFNCTKRGLMRDLLKREKEIGEKIALDKSRFDELLTLAKQLGYEVFERGENKYNIYYALRVGYKEVVSDRQNRDLSPA